MSTSEGSIPGGAVSAFGGFHASLGAALDSHTRLGVAVMAAQRPQLESMTASATKIGKLVSQQYAESFERLAEAINTSLLTWMTALPELTTAQARLFEVLDRTFAHMAGLNSSSHQRTIRMVCQAFNGAVIATSEQGGGAEPEKEDGAGARSELTPMGGRVALPYATAFVLLLFSTALYWLSLDRPTLHAEIEKYLTGVTLVSLVFGYGFRRRPDQN